MATKDGDKGKRGAGDGPDLAGREIARTIARMDRRGDLLRALMSVHSGRATATFTTRDADGNVQSEPLVDLPGGGGDLSPRRRAQVEALRRGLFPTGSAGGDDDPFLEEAPFSEIWIELWNEDPPFLEGPLARGELPDPLFREVPGMQPFFELPPPEPRPDPSPFIDLEPWNEDPPFVEGPWNEDPPFVELAESQVAGRSTHRTSWRWEVKPPSGADPDDLDARRESLENSSILRTWRQIQERIAEDGG